MTNADDLEHARDKNSAHPGEPASPIMRYFEFSHLPKPLATVSAAFYELATFVEDVLPAGAEKSTALRKLLEAKDAAVRAALDI